MDNLELKNYNLMYHYNNENIIGYVEDIIKFYKAYLKELVDDMTDKFELDICYNFVEELGQIEYKKTTLIEVYFNPMGAYEYKILVEKEN